MLPRNHPDGIRIAFDDHRLVTMPGWSFRPPWPCAWVCPNWLTGTRTWAMRQAEPIPAIRFRRWWPRRWRAATASTTPMRCAPGRMARALGCVVKAPSALGTFLRSFR